jgi:hypothetical protein
LVAVENCKLREFGFDGAIEKFLIDNYFFLFSFSKQNFLSEVTNPFSLPDHSPSFKEYTGSKNNRFLSPAQASKNRIQPPSKVCFVEISWCY